MSEDEQDQPQGHSVADTGAGDDAGAVTELVYAADEQSQQLPALTKAEAREADAAAGAVTSSVHTESTRTVAGRNGGTLKPFTPETSQAANRARWDEYQQVVEDKLAELAGSLRAAVGNIVENQYDKVIADGDTRAAAFLFKHAGVTRPANDHAAHGGDSVPAAGSDLDDLLYAHRQRIASDPDYAARVAELRQRRLTVGG